MSLIHNFYLPSKWPTRQQHITTTNNWQSFVSFSFFSFHFISFHAFCHFISQLVKIVTPAFCFNFLFCFLFFIFCIYFFAFFHHLFIQSFSTNHRIIDQSFHYVCTNMMMMMMMMSVWQSVSSIPFFITFFLFFLSFIYLLSAVIYFNNFLFCFVLFSLLCLFINQS